MYINEKLICHHDIKELPALLKRSLQKMCSNKMIFVLSNSTDILCWVRLSLYESVVEFMQCTHRSIEAFTRAQLLRSRCPCLLGMDIYAAFVSLLTWDQFNTLSDEHCSHCLHLVLRFVWSIGSQVSDLANRSVDDEVNIGLHNILQQTRDLCEDPVCGLPLGRLLQTKLTQLYLSMYHHLFDR